MSSIIYNETKTNEFIITKIPLRQSKTEPLKIKLEEKVNGFPDFDNESKITDKLLIQNKTEILDPHIDKKRMINLMEKVLRFGPPDKDVLFDKMKNYLIKELNFPNNRQTQLIANIFVEKEITPIILSEWILKECRLKMMWDNIGPKNEISHGLIEFFNMNYYKFMRENKLKCIDKSMIEMKRFLRASKTRIIRYRSDFTLDEIDETQEKILESVEKIKQFRLYCELEYDNKLELMRGKLLQVYSTLDTIQNEILRDCNKSSVLYN
jgi:hypothetical protein